MTTRITVSALLLFVATFSALGQTSKPAVPESYVPGDIRMLEGYKHIRRPGIDSTVGEISKEGGLTIRYDIGRMAGAYASKCMRDKNCVWFKRQVVNGSELWLGLTKEGEILATFRADDANFFAETKSTEDIVDFLTMVLTYRSPKQKLDQDAQFKPKAETALDELIETAQSFKIPIGIEWTEPTTCKESPATPPTKQSVRRLLNDIVRRCPGYRLAIEHGVVHVYSPLHRHPNNILNLRLWRIEVKKGNTIDASFELRLAIDMELHPEKFRGGWNGGYGGYPSDEVLAVPNITFLARNITVRDVLDRVIKSNGKALWVARLGTATLNGRASLANIYKTGAEIERIWEFLPLKVTRQP